MNKIAWLFSFLCACLVAALIILKLHGEISLPWWMVLSPLPVAGLIAGPLGVLIGLIIVLATYLLIG